MTKFDFNLWDNDSSEEYPLPLFLNTKNLFIKDKNQVDLISVVLFDKYTRLDALIFEKYGGFSLIEQFNIIKVILPLILLYNEINDITVLKPGMFIKFPDLNMLVDNIYLYDENEMTVENSLSFNKDENLLNLLPGLNPINRYNMELSKSIDETKTTGIPSLNLTLTKVKYDNDKGIITY